MNLTIGNRVSVEHFPNYRMMVLYFSESGMNWAETFHDWDWIGMRRAIRRNSVDEEEMHVELIELAKLERRLQTKSTSQWIDDAERRTALRGIPMAMFVVGAVVFWFAAMWKCGELLWGSVR